MIYVADKVKPTEDMLRKGHESNPAGAGLAWREDGFVKWSKGIMDPDEVVRLVAELPTPMVVHFRIPSCGGKTPFLCHPFPINKTASLNLDGQTKGFVLFHNGHWGAWRSTVLETCIKTGQKLPGGRWSDTRGMALTAYHYGIGILDLIDEKSVAFSPTECEVSGSGWSKVNDVWVSNESWKYSTYRNMGGHQMHGSFHGRQSDDTRMLPAHYQGKKSSDDKSGDGDASEGDQGAKDKAGGGSVSGVVEQGDHKTVTSKTHNPTGAKAPHDPFDEAEAFRLWKAGEISKKAWKRVRNNVAQRDAKALKKSLKKSKSQSRLPAMSATSPTRSGPALKARLVDPRVTIIVPTVH